MRKLGRKVLIGPTYVICPINSLSGRRSALGASICARTIILSSVHRKPKQKQKRTQQRQHVSRPLPRFIIALQLRNDSRTTLFQDIAPHRFEAVSDAL